MKNTNLKRRIKKLLENKNTKFKRKYFMLSSLALNESIKDNEVFSKSSCYLDNLLNSNGTHPSEDAIVSLYKESLTKENFSNKDINNNANYIENFSNLLYSNKNLVESMIDDELSSISISNKRLDMKLKESMLESFNSNISLFLESENLEGYDKEDTDLGLEDLGPDEDEEAEVSKKSVVNRLLSDYDFLFKVEKVPYIRNKLKFFIPVESTQEFIDKKIPITDKLSIIKKYDLIENKKASIKDLRKLEIIFHIDYFLNIKQSLIKNDELNKLTDDIREKSSSGLSDFWQHQAGSNLNSNTLKSIKNFQATSSYIDPTIKQKLKAIRRALINKGTFSKDNIDLSSITEKDLFTLLDACLSKDDRKFYMKTKKVDLGLDYLEDDEKVKSIEDKTGHDILKQIKRDLDIVYPIGTDKDFKQMSDDDYLEYLYDLESEEEKRDAEDIDDKEKYGDAYLTPEESDLAKSDLDFYKDKEIVYKKEKYKKKNSVGEFVKDEKSGKDKIFVRDATDQHGDKIVIDYKSVYDEDGEPIGKFEFEEKEAVDLSKYFKGTKKERRKSHIDELIDMSTSPAEMEKALSKYSNLDPNKRFSYDQLADLSHGRFSNHSGVRQEINKTWFKALFFNASHNKKGEIYNELLRKFVEVLQKKDLFRNVGGIKKPVSQKLLKKDIDDKGNVLTKDNISAYFTKDLSTAASSSDVIDSHDIEKYFSGELKSESQYDDESQVKNEILDELLNSNGLFRHFSTSLMKDFYNKEIWSNLELELAHAVAEYFQTNFKNNNIGASLSSNEKSDKVKTEEGKILFNPIIYWVMKRTAVSKKDSGEFNIEQDKKYRADKFRKGFASSIKKHNTAINAYNSNEENINKPSIPTLSFNEIEFDKLINDMSSDTGIIGSIYSKKRKLDDKTYDQFFKWLNIKSDIELSNYINTSLVTSFYHKEGFILDKIKNPNGFDEIVLVKKDNPNELHLLSKQEDAMLSSIAKELKDIPSIDMDSYKEWAEERYINKMSDSQRNNWIENADEVVYYDPTEGIVYNNSEIVDVTDDLMNVILILNPDADNPVKRKVSILYCTEYK
jgi:hypothetical protein